MPPKKSKSSSSTTTVLTDTVKKVKNNKKTTNIKNPVNIDPSILFSRKKPIPSSKFMFNQENLSPPLTQELQQPESAMPKEKSKNCLQEEQQHFHVLKNNNSQLREFSSSIEKYPQSLTKGDHYSDSKNTQQRSLVSSIDTLPKSFFSITKGTATSKISSTQDNEKIGFIPLEQPDKISNKSINKFKSLEPVNAFHSAKENFASFQSPEPFGVSIDNNPTDEFEDIKDFSSNTKGPSLKSSQGINKNFNQNGYNDNFITKGSPCFNATNPRDDWTNMKGQIAETQFKNQFYSDFEKQKASEPSFVKGRKCTSHFENNYDEPQILTQTAISSSCSPPVSYREFRGKTSRGRAMALSPSFEQKSDDNPIIEPSMELQIDPNFNGDVFNTSYSRDHTNFSSILQENIRSQNTKKQLVFGNEHEIHMPSDDFSSEIDLDVLRAQETDLISKGRSFLQQQDKNCSILNNGQSGFDSFSEDEDDVFVMQILDDYKLILEKDGMDRNTYSKISQMWLENAEKNYGTPMLESAWFNFAISQKWNDLQKRTNDKSKLRVQMEEEMSQFNHKTSGTSFDIQIVNVNVNNDENNGDEYSDIEPMITGWSTGLSKPQIPKFYHALSVVDDNGRNNVLDEYTETQNSSSTVNDFILPVLTLPSRHYAVRPKKRQPRQVYQKPIVLTISDPNDTTSLETKDWMSMESQRFQLEWSHQFKLGLMNMLPDNDSMKKIHEQWHPSSQETVNENDYSGIFEDQDSPAYGNDEYGYDSEEDVYFKNDLPEGEDSLNFPESTIADYDRMLKEIKSAKKNKKKKTMDEHVEEMYGSLGQLPLNHNYLGDANKSNDKAASRNGQLKKNGIPINQIQEHQRENSMVPPSPFPVNFRATPFTTSVMASHVPPLNTPMKGEAFLAKRSNDEEEMITNDYIDFDSDFKFGVDAEIKEKEERRRQQELIKKRKLEVAAQIQELVKDRQHSSKNKKSKLSLFSEHFAGRMPSDKPHVDCTIIMDPIIELPDVVDLLPCAAEADPVGMIDRVRVLVLKNKKERWQIEDEMVKYFGFHPDFPEALFPDISWFYDDQGKRRNLYEKTTIRRYDGLMNIVEKTPAVPCNHPQPCRCDSRFELEREGELLWQGLVNDVIRIRGPDVYKDGENLDAAIVRLIKDEDGRIQVFGVGPHLNDAWARKTIPRVKMVGEIRSGETKVWLLPHEEGEMHREVIVYNLNGQYFRLFFLTEKTAISFYKTFVEEGLKKSLEDYEKEFCALDGISETDTRHPSSSTTATFSSLATFDSNNKNPSFYSIICHVNLENQQSLCFKSDLVTLVGPSILNVA